MQPNSPNNSQPAAPAAKPGSEVNLRPDIVANIPLKTQAAPLKPVSDDEDLDKIMMDVGQDLKQVDKSPHKKRFFEFKRQPKPPKHAPPAPAAKAAPVQANAKPAAAPAPKKQSDIPVMAITIAVLMTCILAAAAFKAYK